jgi:anti-sigma factor RsiW
MDHNYIDQQDIVGKLLRKELSTPVRKEFQAHLVDCPECGDRILLAEMFLASSAKPLPPLRAPATPNFAPVRIKESATFPTIFPTVTPPSRMRWVYRVSPPKLAVLLVLGAAFLLSGLLFLARLRNG